MARLKNIPAIEDNRISHCGLDAFEVWISEFLPFRYQQERVGTGDAVVIAGREFDSRSEYPFSFLHGFRIIGRNRGAFAEQLFNDSNGGRIAHIVGSGFEREAPDAKALVLELSLEMIDDAIDKPMSLIVIDGFDGFQNSHRRGVFAACLDQSPCVLWEAAASITHSGEKKRRADTRIGSHAFADHIDIGADSLAQIRNLIHE